MVLQTYNHEDLIKEQMQDFDTAKVYYKQALRSLKEKNSYKFFFHILNILNETQSKDNFKKITGFNYIDFNIDMSNIKTEEDVLKILQLSIIKAGKTNVMRESGLTMPTINKIFNNQGDINLKTFFTLSKVLNLKISFNNPLF